MQNERDLLLNGMDENSVPIEQKNKKYKHAILIIGFVILISYYIFSSPVANKDVIIHISNGDSISSVSDELKKEKVVRSKFTLKVFIELLRSGKGIVAGDYLLKKNSPVFIVAWQISRGHHNILPVKITIREGLTNDEIANLLADKIAGFRKDLFLTETNNKQGYLFPDTYLFFPKDTTEEIIGKLTDNFELKTKNISSFDKTKKFSDILTMASILEGEAGGEEDSGIISGILWKRISLGMPLQVDVDKSTYTNKGLPKEPLNNPGLSSIESALKPIKTPYFFYLHDKNGVVHYAVTFEEHKRNISKYLK